ncbi:FxDxF family PEP-CTERM protein [Duganella callida]
MVVVGDSHSEFGAFAGVVGADAAFTVSAVPEPSTWLMLGGGLALLALSRRRASWGKALRLGLAAGVLLLGATQSARADIKVIDGDTTFANSFDSPLSDIWGLNVHYDAYQISVSADPTFRQSGLVVCEFDCVLLMYQGAFDPKQSDKNLFMVETDRGGAQAISSHMEENQTYVLVVAGRFDYDWGKYSLLISNPGTINISAVPEPAEWGMLLGGLALVGAVARRRQRQA